MSDHLTEQYEPYDPDPNYDWDYEPESSGPKILWGRVVVLGVALLLMFFIGRMTASGDEGVPQERVEELNSQIADLQAEVDRLETDLAAAAADDSAADASPGEGTTEGEGEGTEGESEGTAYTVKSGDTLQSISEQFYGSTEFDDCIEAANGITDPEQLAVGEEITIPDEALCT